MISFVKYVMDDYYNPYYELVNLYVVFGNECGLVAL